MGVCWRSLAVVACLAIVPRVASADVELRWPAFDAAHSVEIERGVAEDSLAPLAKLEGRATSFRDPSPPDTPRACYLVRARDASGRAIDELSRCLTRSQRTPPVSAAPSEDALPGDEPRRWRGLEGWYQVVPPPPSETPSQAPSG